MLEIHSEIPLLQEIIPKGIIYPPYFFFFCKQNTGTKVVSGLTLVSSYTLGNMSLNNSSLGATSLFLMFPDVYNCLESIEQKPG